MAKNKSNESTGPSQRMLRVGELIRRALADVLARDELHDADIARMMITVGEVRVTRDLRVATVYVMPLGGKGKEDVLKILAHKTGELRHAMSRKLSMKYVPELRFRLDETFDRMDDTRRMLAQDDVRRDLVTNTDTDAGPDDPDPDG